MALAKKCDVCGKLYERYNEENNIEDVNGIMFLNIDRVGKYFSHGTMDCCPECMKNIKEFIENLSEVK